MMPTLGLVTVLTKVKVVFIDCISCSVLEIQEQLEKGVVLGIVGMGGIGKAYLAKQLFNTISPEYEYTCFVENVKHVHTRHRLDEELRGQFHRNGVKVKNEFEIEWHHLRGKKTLIVMDDVDSTAQLRVLPPLDGFGNGSNLIITSRNRAILALFREYVVYEAQFLEVNEAKELFCHHAQMEKIPMTDDFEETLHLIIDKCEGLPLSLAVVGSYLRGHANDVKIWKEILEKLCLAESISGSRDHRVWASLRITYDALKADVQHMFIEAGTFFFAQQLEHALVAWETLCDNSRSAWESLVRKSLVRADRKDKWDPICEREVEYMEIWVHEHLRDLAKSILVDHGVSDTRKPTVQAYSWRVHTDVDPNGNETMLQSELSEHSEQLKYTDLDGVVNEGWGENFPSRLVLLKWKMTSMCKLPLISLGKMKNLALLEVENWSVRKVFSEALRNRRKLRILSLCSLEGLDGLPETFGGLWSLQHLTLRDVGILELPKSFGYLSSLVTLKIRGCSELSSLPDSFGLLSSLEELYIYDCPKLSSLGESFGHLPQLKYVSLKRCESLQRLPASFKDLLALEELVVDGCSSIQGLSLDLSHIKTLARLTILGGVPREVLSGNFWSLPALKHLSLKYCWNLEELPPILDLPFLEQLELEGCNGLQGLPQNLDKLIALKRLVIRGAYRLKVLPDSVGRISSLRDIILSDCNGLRSLPRSLRKPYSENDQATEVGKTTDTEGIRLAITECDFLKDEILRRGYVYEKGVWYPKRRHR